MNTLFPLIYLNEKKKKEVEPELLYLELDPPPQKIPDKKEKEIEETGVVIIEL